VTDAAEANTTLCEDFGDSDVSSVRVHVQINNRIISMLSGLADAGKLSQDAAASFLVHWAALDPVQRLLAFNTLERLEGSDMQLSFIKLSRPWHGHSP